MSPEPSHVACQITRRRFPSPKWPDGHLHDGLLTRPSHRASSPLRTSVPTPQIRHTASPLGPKDLKQNVTDTVKQGMGREPIPPKNVPNAGKK
jgi:hypothetical protein